MIDVDRLAQTFKFLVEIDSESRNEKEICEEIRKIMDDLGAKTIVDDSQEKTGSDTGNLIALFAGNVDAPPLLLCAHMDTVQPGKGVKAILENGVFRSQGDTILGADDKSAIAIMIETLRVLKEKRISHCPLEIVFTTCEEIGLQGARHLDYDLITAKFGYVLDVKEPDCIVYKAPGSNRLNVTIHGKDAHAGVEPEKGINAIILAGKAMAGLEIGRVDDETTCNIGVIEGGYAMNIVPNLVKIQGETRSHDETKLKEVTDRIVAAFETVIEEAQKTSDHPGLPRADIEVINEFVQTYIPEEHPVIIYAQQAARNLGHEMVLKKTGGGADANIFFQKGIMTGVLGTGMTDVHTTEESVTLDDMAYATRLLIETVILHSKGV